MGIPVQVNLSSLLGSGIDGVKYYSELQRSGTKDSRDFDRSAIVVFETQQAADRFFRDWHIQFFDTDATSGPVCYLAFIDKVFVSFVDSPEFQTLLPVGSQQIPSCPFCIERIDVNVSGLVTSRRGWLSSGIICSESCVACSTLAQDSVTCCPDSDSRLWLCLLCGNIGCGRYAQGHAESHGRASNHRLSLEISTGRIWDYMGDLFVHRRIVSQPSAPILDLPERIDKSSLPVHPQVSFEEDIRELDSTMARQLSYERSKYEEACTQLKVLGTSRVHEERALLRKEQAQEKEARAALAKSKQEQSELLDHLKLFKSQKKEAEISRLKQGNKVLIDRINSANNRTFGVSQFKLDELARLEKQVEELRLKVSSL
jgi:hypothetical protein